MDDLLPITLVIKAPNQKIADQTVECELDWTIRRLKSHLSEVYPSSPKEHQQKIIYSGKLLTDNLQLKDVLKQFEPNQRIHTVHLVCAAIEANTTTATVSSSNTTQSSSSETMAPTEGVRHRRPGNTPVTTSGSSSNASDNSDTTSTSQSHNTTNTTQQNPAEHNQPGAGQFFNPMTSMGMMAPQAAIMPGFPYSPEQMLWFQQMYAQQMAQYMQYYQGVGHQNTLEPTLGGAQNVVGAGPVGGAVGGNQGAVVGAVAPDRGDQPMVMNAAGDAVMDDDEENGNRDWLDWMYTISRFIVLISIVYFYSTFSRFMLVVGSFLFLYLYQQGWFQIQREVRNQPQRQERPQQENAQNDNGAEADQSSEEDSSSDDPEGESTAPATPAAPPSPGLLRVAFSFVLTFFTSLIPQPPAPVNVN